MLWQLISIVFPIFSIVILGFAYARRHAPDMAAANKLNIEVFIPALVFDVLSAGDFSLGRYQSLAIGGALVILGSALVAWPVARFAGYQLKTFLPPMMFNNCGNMGLPLILFAFGEQALPAAVVLFMVGNALQFSLGIKMLNSSASLLETLRVPSLVATFLGLAASGMHIDIPTLLATPIHMLGQISIPLMLFALGVRLVHVDWQDWKIGMLGALISPLSGLVVAIPAAYLLGLSERQSAILIVFAALPPAVLNYMLAERYNQQPKLVASIVLLGNLSALAIIPLVLAFVL